MRHTVTKYTAHTRQLRISGLAREVYCLTVRRARNVNRISIASPRDFVCVRSENPADAPQTVFPYCLDFLNARAIYAADTGIGAVQGAPFYYLHLRRRARRLLSVPIEHGPVGRLCGHTDPVFLFSAGRCGSTLVSRILSEAGIASVSEPDFYTQMSSWFWSRRSNPLHAPFLRAMWHMTDDLTVALGKPPVIKLRAECAKAPALFVRDTGSRAIVMVRSFESWARSTARVFGNPPDKIVRKYLTALHCYAYLQRRSTCHLLIYEKLLADPVEVGSALGRFLGTSIRPQAVARAMANDAQAGTPLARRSRLGWEAKFDGAMRLWGSPRLVAAREKLAISGVWN